MGEALERMLQGCEMPEDDGKRLRTLDAVTLMQMEFPPQVCPVHDLIVEGLTLLVAPSKGGKSWFMLALCCAVASGECFLGRDTDPGQVLYLALEDTARRLQKRLISLKVVPPANLQFATMGPALESGLVDALSDWVQRMPAPKLIVIDTLQSSRTPSPSNVNAYALEYAQMRELKSFADQHRVALVLVHHTNKRQNVDDPFDKISGTTALMGAADTTILLDGKRGSKDATLRIVSRDIFTDDIDIRMNEGGLWQAIGTEVLARGYYDMDPVVRTVKAICPPGFVGPKSILPKEMTAEVGRQTGIAMTVQQLNQALKKEAQSLQQFDGITVKFDKRIGTRKYLQFIRGELPEALDAEQMEFDEDE